MDLETLNAIGLKCPNPRRIRVPALDKYGDYRENNGELYVPCGRCYVCLSARRMQWQFRLEMESLRWSRSLFVTLTMDDEHLHELDKRDLQLLFKRLRRVGLRFSYYAIGEYGTRTKRPHYHAVLFTDSDSAVSLICSYWQYGFVYFGDVTSSSIGYVLHYHVRPKLVDGRSTFAIQSKGLGLDWFGLDMQKFFEQKNDFIVRNIHGTKSILPRYYRKKFLSDKPISDVVPKYEIGVNKHDFQYLLDLRDVFAEKLKKYNYQDKL